MDTLISIVDNIKNKFGSYNRGTDKDLANFFNSNSAEYLQKFNKYLSDINIESIKNKAPQVAYYSDSEIVKFLDYHLCKDPDKLEFTEDDLTLTKDFTKFLTDNYVKADGMKNILTVYPLTDRNVGELPKGWLENIDKNDYKEVNDKVQSIIDSFRKTRNENYLKTELSGLLGKNVDVKYLGRGKLGGGWKISMDNCEPVVLKVFHETPELYHPLHGREIETQTGLFLNNNSDKFVHMYFGRVCGKNNNDGYLVTQYMGKDTEDLFQQKNNSDLVIKSTDAHGDHNIINGKIIDYGAVVITDKFGNDISFNVFDKKNN